MRVRKRPAMRPLGRRASSPTANRGWAAKTSRANIPDDTPVSTAFPSPGGYTRTSFVPQEGERSLSRKPSTSRRFARCSLVKRKAVSVRSLPVRG